MADVEDGRFEQLLDQVSRIQRDVGVVRRIVSILLVLALIPVAIVILQLVALVAF